MYNLNLKFHPLPKRVNNIFWINDGLPVQEETVMDCYLGQSSVGTLGSDNKWGLL